MHDDRPDSTAPPGVEDRYCDLSEFAAATSFLPEQYDYLQALSFDHALKVIAAAVPVGLLHAIYLTIVADHLHNLDEHVSPTAYVIDAGDSLAALERTSNDGFDFENFELQLMVTNLSNRNVRLSMRAHVNENHLNDFGKPNERRN